MIVFHYFGWQSPEEIAHAQAEEREYRAAMHALEAGDEAQYRKHWQAFVTLHRQRPASFVEKMERARGLR